VKILFVADGRSPIALNWIAYFVDQGHEVHLVSTFPCEPALRLASLNCVPVAFSQMKGKGIGGRGAGEKGRGVLLEALGLRARTAVRQAFGVLTVPQAARRLRPIIAAIQPDLIHAMRIPYEGMLAAEALREFPDLPLLVSVWGNDFTLHAASNPWMGSATRWTLARANALHVDCQRDLRLAHRWGFNQEKPAIVLPGNGGVQTDLFYPPQGERSAEIVINPRGFRAYVRNDTFFKAIPLVLARRPGVKFICPAMTGEPRARRWLNELGIAEAVELLPTLPRLQMADLFRRATVAVSPSTHDGTPNTLLEEMACGCFPIVGDLESLREWITPGLNGLLVDPGDPCALADAILIALEQPELRHQAVSYNLNLIAERAEHSKVMAEAQRFYLSICE